MGAEERLEKGGNKFVAEIRSTDGQPAKAQAFEEGLIGKNLPALWYHNIMFE